MANASIAKDLGRLAKALDQQTPRWGPVLVTLLGAEDKAASAFMDTTILKKAYTTSKFEKDRAFAAAFTNTTCWPLPSGVPMTTPESAP